jgi:hypothetical protein
VIPLQSRKLVQLTRVHAEIAQVENLIAGAYDGVVASDQLFGHGVNVRERAVAILDNVGVAKVLIARKPNHGSLFL